VFVCVCITGIQADKIIKKKGQKNYKQREKKKQQQRLHTKKNEIEESKKKKRVTHGRRSRIQFDKSVKKKKALYMISLFALKEGVRKTKRWQQWHEIVKAKKKEERKWGDTKPENKKPTECENGCRGERREIRGSKRSRREKKFKFTVPLPPLLRLNHKCVLQEYKEDWGDLETFSSRPTQQQLQQVKEKKEERGTPWSSTLFFLVSRCYWFRVTRQKKKVFWKTFLSVRCFASFFRFRFYGKEFSSPSIYVWCLYVSEVCVCECVCLCRGGCAQEKGEKKKIKLYEKTPKRQRKKRNRKSNHENNLTCLGDDNRVHYKTLYIKAVNLATKGKKSGQ
jgi:hypothetical protein